jgi:hypothetical protein
VPAPHGSHKPAPGAE